MTDTANSANAGPLTGWRIALWGALLALLLLPAVAMQLTDEVDWTAGDFLFAAILLGALGLGLELALRRGLLLTRRLAIVAFAGAAFFTLWSNAAVGIIGEPEADINMAFTLLSLAAVVGAAIVRLRASPMMFLLGFVAAMQMPLGVLSPWMEPGAVPVWPILVFLTGLWAVPAVLFGLSARDRA